MVIVFLTYASTESIPNLNWKREKKKTTPFVSPFPNTASFPEGNVKIGEKDNRSHGSYTRLYTASSADRGLLYT